MVRKISKTIEQEIVAQYWNYTAKELGEKYNIKLNTIKGIWQRNGCRGKKQQKIFNPNPQEFIDYYKTHSIQETANFYQKDRHTITKFAKEINIYQNISKISKEEKQKIIDGYYIYSSKELAEKYNISQSYVTAIWSKAGLKDKTSRVYTLNETFFNKIDTDEKAYWLGFIAADGCVYEPKDNRQKILSIGLQNTDKDHLIKLANSLSSNKPVSEYTRSSDNRTYVNIQFSSNQLCNDLEKYGITPRKTYNIIWPKINEELIPAYIRGYFDGDGSISHSFDKNSLHTVNISITGFYNNLINFQNFLKRKDIPSTFIQDKRTTKDKFGSIVFTDKNTKLKFLHLIYDNALIYLDRKYLLSQQFIQLCKENSKTWKLNTPS